MTQKIFFLSFFLMMCSIIIYASDVTITCDSLIFNDSFNYTSNIGSPTGLWTSSGTTGGCGGADDTINSVFTTRAFGINGTGYCASTSSGTGTLIFPTNYTTGTIILSYNFSSQRHPVTAVDGLKMTLGDINGRDIYIEANTNGQSTIKTSSVGLGNFQSCTLNNAYSIPNQGHIVFVMDLDDKTYTLYFDGDSEGCRNYAFANSTYDYKLRYLTISGEFPSTSLAQIHEHYIDDVMVCNGSTEKESCDYPTLFCDDFDYTTPLYDTKGWDVFDSNLNFNDDFSPEDNVCALNSSEPKSIIHDVNPFPVGRYTEDCGDSDEGYCIGSFITYSEYAPVFMNEFDITFKNTSFHEIDFKTFDSQNDLCYVIRFQRGNLNNDLSLQFYNESGNWHDLSSDFINANFTTEKSYHVKVVAYLTAWGKTNILFYNTSYGYNHINIFINDSAYHYNQNTTFSYSCDNIKSASFVRENTSSDFLIDDYFMAVGVDKYIDTVDNYEFPVYTNASPTDEHIITGSTGVRDLKQSIDGFWEQWGLITTASKFLFGLGMMVLFGIFIIAIFVSKHIVPPIGVICFLEVGFMIFLIYIGLMPIWIAVVLGLIGAGLGTFALKAQFG